MCVPPPAAVEQLLDDRDAPPDKGWLEQRPGAGEALPHKVRLHSLHGGEKAGS
jgi:hypothetical protein